MADERTERVTAHLRTLLEERGIPVNKIMVFGSFATGKADETSDMDMAIISDAFDGKDIFERTEAIQGIPWAMVKKFDMPFDILTLSTSEFEEGSSMLAEFAREGIEYK